MVFEYLLHVAEVKLHFLQHIFLRKMRHHFFGEHSHAVKRLALLKSSHSESSSDGVDAERLKCFDSLDNNLGSPYER